MNLTYASPANGDHLILISESMNIDVVASNGDFVAAEGPVKANNLRKLSTELRIYEAIVNERGVSAQAYLTEGTPQSVIDLATKTFGPVNVKTSRTK